MKPLALFLALACIFAEGLSSPLSARTDVPVYYQRVCHEGKCRYVPIGTAYYVAPDYYDYDPSALSIPGSWVESIVGVF